MPSWLEGGLVDAKEKKTVAPKPAAAGVAVIAKRDFVICQNEILIKIKKGDDLLALQVPERFFPNLKTEGVI